MCVQEIYGSSGFFRVNSGGGSTHMHLPCMIDGGQAEEDLMDVVSGSEEL